VGEDSDTTRALIPMMLIGAWNAKAKADTEILSVLANRPYEQIEEDVTRLLQFETRPCGRQTTPAQTPQKAT